MRVEIAPGIFMEVSDAEDLAEVMQAREENPMLGYFPHGRQLLFHQAIARNIPLSTTAFFGGNRSGKTHCSIADDLIQLLDREYLPPHLLPYKKFEPPVHIWIAVPQHKKIEEVAIKKLRELAPRSAFVGGGLDKAYSKQDGLIKFANGSTIGFKTFDQDVDAYSGAEIHRIHWDEEPEGDHGRAIRGEARMRLISTRGDEVISMTPLFGYSWVYEDVASKAQDDERITVIRADIEDNPHLDPEAVDAALSGYTDEELQARKSGEFIHFRGLVYAEFNDRAHVLMGEPPIKHVKGLDTIVGIDPGIRTTAVVWCGFDNDNAMMVYDELYLHDRDAIPENAAKLIQQKNRAWGVDPDWYVIDPSSRNRNLVTGQNVQTAYQLAGIPIQPGQAEPEAGCFEIKRRLQHDPPMMTVSPACQKWLWERGIYRMDDRADGKFAVVKEHDHLMDATRYVAMSRPIGPSAGPPEPKRHEYRYGYAPPAEYLNQYDPTTGPPLGSMT
jgi:hypothetical protein